MLDVKISTPIKNTVLLLFPTWYKMCFPLIRFQEFYESEFDNIRGKYFTLDEYMETYANAHKGEFDYFDTTAGMNIPGSVVVDFYNLFKDNLRPCEVELIKHLCGYINNYTNSRVNFYVIAAKTGDTGTIDHELAHAFYYLLPDYRNEVEQIIANMKNKRRVYNKVKRAGGYCDATVIDEIQAYTVGAGDVLDRRTKKTLPWQIRDVFIKYRNANIIDRYY